MGECHMFLRFNGLLHGEMMVAQGSRRETMYWIFLRRVRAVSIHVYVYTVLELASCSMNIKARVISSSLCDSIWTNLNPLHPRMLCTMFGWNWPSGSGEEDANVKSLWQRQRRRQRRQRKRRRTTDKFWSEKLTWAFGSGELKRNNKQTINHF